MGVKGQKWPKMKNNYIRHASYLRNSKVRDHNFWYTCVIWLYLQGFSSFFLNFFIFWAVRGGVKGEKNAQMKNNNYIRHMPYLRNSIAYDHDLVYLSKMVISPGLFFIFLKCSIFRLLGGKRAKNGPRWQKKIWCASHPIWTIYHMIVIYGTLV